MFKVRRGFLAVITQLVFALVVGFGNDSYVNIAGDEISLETEHSDIGIRSEVLTITLFDSYYAVQVDYTFFNVGPEVNVTTAFPEYRTSEGLASSKARLENFRMSYETGEEIEHSYRESELKLSDYFGIVGWYLKSVQFAANAETKIRVSYTAEYNPGGTYGSADYLLGTGRTWNGTIEDLRIIMINESDVWIDGVSLAGSTEYDYSVLADGRYEIRVRNWEPDLMDELSVLTQSDPVYNRSFLRTLPTQFVFRNSALTSKWFRFLSSVQLRILRNSIYAMHGYRFASQDLRLHFEKEEWYTPSSSFSEALFNENERHNIELILEAERQVQ